MDLHPQPRPATPPDQEILTRRPFTAPSVDELGHLNVLTLQETGGGELDMLDGSLDIL